MEIIVSEEIRQRCPDFVGCAVLADFCNSEFSQGLWDEINEFIADYRLKYSTESIKQMPSIEATRAAYRRCGKDPRSRNETDYYRGQRHFRRGRSGIH